ncbi:phosphocholine cytidylyltransferase family protein [Sphingomonas ginkgonis]|uniref:Phosphocholine cytidylyltransferase family protein n=1 Tax=Sphingomonas ginkgonis TaxID=2315330 RepID=A0A3R9Y3T0_9SPHN|nr:phosphocholine cytidylyltransferase family protein [Sphingomonas ginkgonis]RST29547.1 phosphocholine cytidylyltransferase family protein [Sphingomonas ginkgonis]
MRAIILSAGRGSRLLPLTELMPKCLVPVGGRAILDHQLRALAEAGVERAVVVAGYRFDQVGAHLALHAPPLPVELRFNPFWAVSSSIGSVWAARDLLDEAFCLMNGDTTLDGELLGRAFAAAGRGVGLVVEPLAEPHSDDMLATVEGRKVTAVAKSLDPASATHRSLGVVVAGASSDYPIVLERVIAGTDGINAYHHDVVNALASQGEVEAIVEDSGSWQEIDRPEDIERWSARANRRE